jgi:hypothetical protein
MARERNAAGVPPGTSATRPGDFPWRRDPDRCELCGELARVLFRVVLEDSAPRRRARVVYACSRHHAGSNGDPLEPPRSSMASGTSRLKPQDEQLFDSAPYRRGGAK